MKINTQKVTHLPPENKRGPNTGAGDPAGDQAGGRVTGFRYYTIPPNTNHFFLCILYIMMSRTQTTTSIDVYRTLTPRTFFMYSLRV